MYFREIERELVYKIKVTYGDFQYSLWMQEMFLRFEY
jgi:hypothetical protein